MPEPSALNLPEILALHAQWLADPTTGQRANLDGASLVGANLDRASLVGANLDGAAGLAIATDAPQRLRAAATAALQEGALEMQTWHECETTHCLGGWLIYQAGELGRLLEAAVGPSVAGLMLGGVEAHSHFYDSNEAAAEWLRSVLERPEARGFLAWC
jgi:hypothetical protein